MLTHPPADAQDFTFSLADAVGIPVVMRTGHEGADLKRPERGKWLSAVTLWPSRGTLPPDGVYLAMTTWRDIVQSAIGVGRDLTPWLKQTPALAVNELVARVSPLHAYLIMRSERASATRRLFVSAVYRHGVESSAQGAFGYHLGMTMAQWVSVCMAGVSRTLHVEARWPAASTGKLPDLTGRHEGEDLEWLIEAKAGKALGGKTLARGVEQLQSGSARLPVARHRSVLCGTSLPSNSRWELDPLFMTINSVIEEPPSASSKSTPPAQSPDDPAMSEAPTEQIVQIAHHQMLIYKALVSGTVADRRIVPLARERDTVRASILSPLERDESTMAVRQRIRGLGITEADDLLGQDDAESFVCATLPTTGIHIGLSQRLFASCQVMDALLGQLTLPDIAAVLAPAAGPTGTDDTVRVRGIREEIGDTVAQVYRTERRMSWRELLAGAPARVAADDNTETGPLESASTDTYLAVSPFDPVLAASDPI